MQDFINTYGTMTNFAMIGMATVMILVALVMAIVISEVTIVLRKAVWAILPSRTRRFFFEFEVLNAMLNAMVHALSSVITKKIVNAIKSHLNARMDVEQKYADKYARILQNTIAKRSRI